MARIRRGRSVAAAAAAISVSAALALPVMAAASPGQGVVPAAVVGDAELTFTPTADAWVDRSHPRANHGGARRLAARTSPVADALMRFEVSGIGTGNDCSTVAGASLTMTVGSSSGDDSRRGGDFYGTTSRSWTESTVSWNNAPATSGSPVARLTGRVSRSTAYDVDVSALVKGNGPITIRVKNPSSDVVRYFSKEAGTATAPTLHVRCHEDLSRRVLTPDGSDTFDVGLAADVITMSAPATNASSNHRELFWPTGEPAASDAQVCATWLDQTSERVQQGLALRIVDGPTSTRAVTVTKNIWANFYWVFNVHTWDTSLEQPYTGIGQFNMSSVLLTDNTTQPLPWRICAKVVGSTFTFKVWLPDSEPEPDWSDPDHVGSTTVPSDYLAPGKAGWYVGHIPPGGSAHYNDLGIWQPPPA